MTMSYSNPTGMTAEERRQAQEEAREEKRQEGLEENQAETDSYQQDSAEFPTTTRFMDYSLNGLKQMLASANPNGIQGVGENWGKVRDQLVGSDGTGAGDCAYGQLKKAVDNVLEHWEGKSANQFRSKANDILQNIFNTGTHCETVSTATKQAAEDLRNQKKRLDALEEPSWLERAGDRLTDLGRDDEYTHEQLRNKDLPKDVLAELEEDHLSAGMEVKLQASAIMETLGRSYVQYKARIKLDGGQDDQTAIPPSNPAIPMPAPLPAFSGTSPTPAGSRKGGYKPSANVGAKTPATTGPRNPGITGGKQVPVSETKLDTVKPGLSGPVTEGPTSGGSRAVAPGANGPSGPHATPNVPTGGGMLHKNPGATRGASPKAGIRGAGPGANAGRNAAGGFRGMGGGGGGANGRNAGTAGGRGPLARAKGGVAGAPRGIAGGRPATAGGTGLGKGRGGPSSSSSARGGMLAGGARGSIQRAREDEREELTRPDYLLEDEETWTPEDKRSVPRTIE